MEPKVLKAALYGNNNDDSTWSTMPQFKTCLCNLSENSLENINWDAEQKTKYQENTVLHVAATSGNKKTAEKILETQPSLVLHQNKKLDTPLHIAARLGYVDVSSLLISHTNTYAQNTERGIARNPFQKVNLSKNTALHEAVRFGHHSIVKLLIEQDRDLTSLTNEAGESPLFLAFERKLHTIALYILENCPDSASFLQGRNGMTAMHAAVIGMPPQRNIFVEKLLKFITDWFQRHLTAQFFFSIFTLQSFAIIGEDGSAIIKQKDVLLKVMEKCGSEILQKKDDLGWLPLHYAAHMGNVQVVKLFLRKNIDLAYEKVDDKEGMSSLHIAASKGLKGHIGVIRTLVKECPEVCESLDNRDRTALHVAVESGKTNVVKTMLNMLEFNDLINEQDKDGNTCLHLAAFHVPPPAILIMLAIDRRVETAILNKMGLTAVDIISSNMQLSQVDKAFMISMLKKEGCMPSLKRIVVRETTSVDENIEGHERSQETKQRLKMPVAEGSGTANSDRENNKKKHHVTPNSGTRENKHIRNIASINLLVATIIASITFAAAMQIPGGYDSQGIANLRRNSSFKIFVMADSVAFGCAAASMFIHFAIAIFSVVLPETYPYPIISVMLLTLISITSAFLAFMSGASMIFRGSSHGGFDAVLPEIAAALSFMIPLSYFFLILRKVTQLLMPSV